MSASNATVLAVFAILRRHCDSEQITAIMEDLQSVPGNKSFRDTIAILTALAKAGG